MKGLVVKGRHVTESGLQSHAFGDANEAAAIALVYTNLPWIPVPRIYFQGKVRSMIFSRVTKIDDVDYLIESRIEGVGLNVTWPYLSSAQKLLFKRQARDIR